MIRARADREEIIMVAVNLLEKSGKLHVSISRGKERLSLWTDVVLANALLTQI